ncbi:UPF0676 protein C1494.01 [Eurytemora carolleeae]|uniref:UPF0676 protein C1494.01 n=1 Tax=Eurytemora carolleeae TaxID=1294199 RepID=UPI000C7673C3|nr:UPF0676 protein C1494.01 [Eurytemora carolleeae]|eukprot:XP_023345783.1 UPF0676 protein C1494.01-like [Eurytemora affinis]
MSAIKILDVEKISLVRDDISPEDVADVGAEISDAFQHIGFAYIKNHGIPQDVIDNAFKSSLSFFKLEDEVKSMYPKGGDYQGWVCEGREIFDQDEDGKIADHEVRETYDLLNISSGGKFPDKDCPTLRPALVKLGELSVKLSLRILQCISVSLNQDPEYLLNQHQGVLDQGIGDIATNGSTLRSIHYPPISEDEARPGIVRCGEHSDYGTFTLLFQDDMGGLEAKSVDGSWVLADPVPGTILMNVGDLLENITAGRFQATRHRVRIPEEELRRKCARQSIAFFVHPDDEVLCEPLSGPDSRYPPVTAKQHLYNRLSATYGAAMMEQK